MDISEAKRTMDAAASKAPQGQRDAFAPYLRAAITYWRLKEKAAEASDDVIAQVEAVTQRLECEDQFRAITGRSFHTVTDAITFAEVSDLPSPK